eukprot:TRINITY_DN102407_c0_g1_i1.p1 TRINITY_DN102407_c0_g1~~TRINITY_DN102407_c0_g1_i1.p1  ORF type:complete len:640 (-),score=117.03 TRINITY_DN102407_c0_g1_i1:118-1995(-)
MALLELANDESSEDHHMEDPVAVAGSEDAAASSLAAVGIGCEELSTCVSVLERLHEAQLRGSVDPNAKCLRTLRKAMSLHFARMGKHLPQKDAIDEHERKRQEKDRKRERRQRQLEADKRWKENAQLRATRLARLEALEMPDDDLLALPGPDPRGCAVSVHSSRKRIPDGPARVEGVPCVFDGHGAVQEDETYSRQQACYICKTRFLERHHFYSHLCPSCANLNFEKRHRRCDMTGRICLVTGARLKIGFEVALKLLRMGARVLAVTRFPQDAQRRYAAEADAADWRERLQVIGADFRFLAGVEALCAKLVRQESHLDVLVNNACQTIRRPAAYYAHLLHGETEGGGSGGYSGKTAALFPAYAERFAGSTSLDLDNSKKYDDERCSGSAAMSQMAVLAEDCMKQEDKAIMLPNGERDVHGQQLDIRSSNSWLLKLGEVQTPEAVEVFCINTLAPFVLNSRLRPLLERSPYPDRYIVNVSAMEGKFYRYKQPTHPHTNMAKAALNMMTRTCAEDLATVSGIYMNSVDTGWINDENPLPTAQRIASSHGFQTPIDEVDAASRILDPVLSGMEATATAAVLGVEVSKRRARKGGGGAGGGGACTAEEQAVHLEPPWGKFLKDYAQTEW